MLARTARIAVLCAVLGMLAGQAFGQDTVKLEYKFKQGELLRYKMIMNMTMQMSGIGGEEAEVPAMSAQTVAVTRQRTKKVLPNGDAEVTSAVESMKMTMGDKTQELPVDKMPVVTMVISKNGTVKSIKGLDDKMPTMFGGMDLSALGQLGGLPEGEVKVGDTWSQDVPFPTGGWSLQVSGELLSTDTKLGKYKVATFKLNIGGDVSSEIPIPASSDETSSTGGNMAITGTTSGDATVYFSCEKGQIIRTEGTTTAQIRNGDAWLLRRPAERGRHGHGDGVQDVPPVRESQVGLLIERHSLSRGGPPQRAARLSATRSLQLHVNDRADTHAAHALDILRDFSRLHRNQRLYAEGLAGHPGLELGDRLHLFH